MRHFSIALCHKRFVSIVCKQKLKIFKREREKIESEIFCTARILKEIMKKTYEKEQKDFSIQGDDIKEILSYKHTF
jgi:hypothetical protein